MIEEDYEYDYLREKAFVDSERQVIENQSLKELKPAKIEVETKIKNYDTENTKSN